MNTNKISVNLFRNCLEERGFEVRFFYDRVKIYVDSANKWSKIEKICSNPKRHKIVPRSLMHYDTMNLMVDARQPDQAYFERMENALKGDYLINYVEFAMDILCDTQTEVTKIRRLIDQILIFQRKKNKNSFYFGNAKNTHYFGHRNQHKDVLVVYSSKPFKLDKNRRSVHIELRFYGSKKIKELGIYTVQDLMNFQYETIWDEYLDLRDVKYNKLGRLYRGVKEDLAESSYWRHGQKFFNKHLSAQQLLNKEPHYAKAFVPIKDRRMFVSRLDNALK